MKNGKGSSKSKNPRGPKHGIRQKIAIKNKKQKDEGIYKRGGRKQKKQKAIKKSTSIKAASKDKNIKNIKNKKGNGNLRKKVKIARKKNKMRKGRRRPQKTANVRVQEDTCVTVSIIH